MEIYLLRHGTTHWNAEHRIQGNTDTPLDQMGLDMARATGEALREQGIRFDRVYSSPLLRAYRTTELAAGADAEIVTDPRLQELCFGVQEGKIINELIDDPAIPFRYFKTDPKLYDRLVSEGRDTLQAESLTELCARAADFLREIVEGQTAGDAQRHISRILISAHGACNKALLMHIRGDHDLANFWANGLQPNCGVDIIDYDPETGIYRIREMNRTFYPEDLTQSLEKLL